MLDKNADFALFGSWEALDACKILPRGPCANPYAMLKALGTQKRPKENVCGTAFEVMLSTFPTMRRAFR